MQRRCYAIIAVILAVIVMAVPVCQGQQLFRPSITVPDGWSLNNDIPYPDATAQHDPEGAGYLLYLSSVNYIDEVRIWYEKAQVESYNDSSLIEQAEDMYRQNSVAFGLVGTRIEQVAGVRAGYAKGVNELANRTVVFKVFIKEGFFFSIIEYYDSSARSEHQVNLLTNSITLDGLPSPTPPPTPTQPPTPTPTDTPVDSSTILVVVSISLVAVAVLLLFVASARKKKKATFTKGKRQ